MKDSLIWLRTFGGRWAVQQLAGASKVELRGTPPPPLVPLNAEGAAVSTGQLDGKGRVFGCSSLALDYEAVDQMG